MGDIIIRGGKRGWDYLWIRYGDSKSDPAKALIKIPMSAHIERVFIYTDFSQLGIGAGNV